MRYILILILVFIPSILFAKDYNTIEKDKIRNNKYETLCIIYYRREIKIKVEYIKGNKHSVIFTPSEILKLSKKLEADKIVFIHNHPSNILQASINDKKVKNNSKIYFDNKNKIRTLFIVVTKSGNKEY
jgi:DNA repair protein RadC